MNHPSWVPKTWSIYWYMIYYHVHSASLIYEYFKSFPKPFLNHHSIHHWSSAEQPSLSSSSQRSPGAVPCFSRSHWFRVAYDTILSHSSFGRHIHVGNRDDCQAWCFVAWLLGWKGCTSRRVTCFCKPYFKGLGLRVSVLGLNKSSGGSTYPQVVENEVPKRPILYSSFLWPGLRRLEQIFRTPTLQLS